MLIGRLVRHVAAAFHSLPQWNSLLLYLSSYVHVHVITQSHQQFRWVPVVGFPGSTTVHRDPVIFSLTFGTHRSYLVALSASSIDINGLAG